MQKVFPFLFILGLVSCSPNQVVHESDKGILDNAELIEIYKNDQDDRKTDKIDWKLVSQNDRDREARIYQLLDSGKVRTSKDYHNAAMIFQHGQDSTAYGMAVELMRKSIDLDSTARKWLLAAAIDRYLLSKDEPQIYGTQYQRFGKDEPWQMGNMDTTQITDAERIAYGVETLAQQKEKLRRMNLKKLSELVDQGKSMNEVISLIQKEGTGESEFDISENAINRLAYNILGKGQEIEALSLFQLNTELFPDGFNTWDSYGECLMLLGQKEDGIKAYEKSLELNPKNKNAEKVISENK
ncbi:MAG: tetratricopeptide (TPR) repeat protein [Sphingobacteriales bacterium]|jgi:tetratricopeptide (TPR) repeat protein